MSAQILEGKCALVSLVALMLLPACAGPNVVDGPVPPEPHSSTIETESSMLVDDEAIETIAQIIWSEFDMDLSRIHVRFKWDSDNDAWSEISYIKLNGSEFIPNDPPKAYVNPDLNGSIEKIRNSLAAHSDICTHLELIFFAEGKYNIKQGFGPFSMEPELGFWPDDITAEVYTYSEGW